jgi:hypothetical protein
MLNQLIRAFGLFLVVGPSGRNPLSELMSKFAFTEWGAASAVWDRARRYLE